MTQLTPWSPQLELSNSPSDYDVLDKVDLSGHANWDPEDQQKAKQILKEYAAVHAKDDLDLGQTSVVKHKITLKERVHPIKE